MFSITFVTTTTDAFNWSSQFYRVTLLSETPAQLSPMNFSFDNVTKAILLGNSSQVVIVSTAKC